MSTDRDGNKWHGEELVMAIDADGRERWRYPLAWWRLEYIDQSRDGSMLVLSVAVGEGIDVPVVLNRYGEEQFRMDTQFRVALAPSLDGTHLVRLTSFRHLAVFTVIRDDVRESVDWGASAFIGLDGEPLPGSIQLDYRAGTRVIDTVQIQGEEMILTETPGSDDRPTHIELLRRDGTVVWMLEGVTRVPNMYRDAVFSDGEWAQDPIAVMEKWTQAGSTYTVETVAVSLVDGSVKSHADGPRAGLVISGNGRQLISQFSNGCLMNDVAFDPLCWARPSGWLRDLSGFGGVVWGQAEGVSGVERVMFPSCEILDFRSCETEATTGSPDKPIRPIALEGIWGVARIDGQVMYLVGQVASGQPVRAIRLNLRST